MSSAASFTSAGVTILNSDYDAFDALLHNICGIIVLLVVPKLTPLQTKTPFLITGSFTLLRPMPLVFVFVLIPRSPHRIPSGRL